MHYADLDPRTRTYTPLRTHEPVSVTLRTGGSIRTLIGLVAADHDGSLPTVTVNALADPGGFLMMSVPRLAVERMRLQRTA